MKSLVFVSMFLLLVSCPKQKETDISKRIIELEKLIDSTETVLQTAILQNQDTTILEKNLKSYTKEYNELQHKYPWFKGREIPYEKILFALLKAGYDLSDFQHDEDGTLIALPNNWNMEDVTKIINIIMKTLPFEPEESKNEFIWTGSKYDVDVYMNVYRHIAFNFTIKNQ